MSKTVLFAFVVVCAGTLMFAGRVSAQWSSPTTAAAVEQDGQNKAGVSVGRCGNHVVVGFGDHETGGVGTSFAGYAVSADAGKTFRDLGVLPVSSQNNGFGLDQLGGVGNPNMPNTEGLSVACADGGQLFYYAIAAVSANDPQDCGAPVCSAISLSTSSDSFGPPSDIGVKWGLPVFVARAPITNHNLNSPSLAVFNDTLYLAYVETNSAPLDSDFSFPECAGNKTTEIRLLISSDDGNPRQSFVLDHSCDVSSDPERQGALVAPKVAFDLSSNVFVAYEFQASAGRPNEIRMVTSLDEGNTFGASKVVSTNAVLNAFPQVGLDPSISNFFGTVYLTWSGLSDSGGSTEVLFANSFNQGATFSAPQPIIAIPHGVQTNQVLDVTFVGDLGACFYSRPDAAVNTDLSSFICATSSNQGTTWRTQELAKLVPAGFGTVTRDMDLDTVGLLAVFEVNKSGRTVMASLNPEE